MADLTAIPGFLPPYLPGLFLSEPVQDMITTGCGLGSRPLALRCLGLRCLDLRCLRTSHRHQEIPCRSPSQCQCPQYLLTLKEGFFIRNHPRLLLMGGIIDAVGPDETMLLR